MEQHIELIDSSVRIMFAGLNNLSGTSATLVSKFIGFSCLSFSIHYDAFSVFASGITILLSLSVFELIVAEMVPSTSMAVPLIG